MEPPLLLSAWALVSSLRPLLARRREVSGMDVNWGRGNGGDHRVVRSKETQQRTTLNLETKKKQKNKKQSSRSSTAPPRRRRPTAATAETRRRLPSKILDFLRVAKRGERVGLTTRESERNEKNPTSNILFLSLFSNSPSKKTTSLPGIPSSTPRTGRSRRLGSSRRGWLGSTRKSPTRGRSVSFS